MIITHTETDDDTTSITEGFRPGADRAAAHYPIFRFFPQWADERRIRQESSAGIFWYCRGVMIKPGVGITLAEHPTDLGPDGSQGADPGDRNVRHGLDDFLRHR